MTSGHSKYLDLIPFIYMNFSAPFLKKIKNSNCIKINKISRYSCLLGNKNITLVEVMSPQ